MNRKMKQTPSNEQQLRKKINAQSNLLTADENETVFGLLGRKCQTLSTAVVQIYRTEGSAHSHWKKKHTGVVCFVKDSCIRSYFLRAYCLIRFELIWEHEVYENLRLTKARPFLLTFEGQDGHVGLNFVSEEECDLFYRTFEMQIEARNRKKQERRSRSKSQTAPNIPPSSQANSITNHPIKSQHTIDSALTSQPDVARVQLRNPSKMGQISMTLTPSSATAQQQSSTKSFLSSSFGLSNSNKDKKKKYTKADISTPMNFVHVSHVGWDADKGFDLTGNEDDEMLTNFFTKAGVGENELNDRDTRAFIYDFIQSNNVLASVKSERVEKPKVAPPPPVPSRHQPSQNGTDATEWKRTAPPPPPPPARQPPPPIPTTSPGSSRIQQPTPPTRPAPVVVTPPVTAPPAPPPPPPPVPQPPPPPPPMPTKTVEIPTITTTAPTSSSQPKPVVDDSRNALMESIRKGITLRKVDPATLSTGSGDSRSDLMSEIRLGIELRPAQNRELPVGSNRASDDGGGTDALADALRRALQERGRVIQSSDDDDSESSANDDEWDD